MASVLFDEAHGELLRSDAEPEKDKETDTRTLLDNELSALGMTIFVQREAWSEDSLSACQVLAIIAPTTPFSLQEIEAIEKFVRDGGGLLLMANAEALWRQPDDSFHLLAERFGLRFEHYYNFPPEEIRDFRPCFITSGVGQISSWEVSLLTILRRGADAEPRPLAFIPETGDLFAAYVEAGRGRVVAIGDFVFLGDKKFSELDNRTFARNLFRWLAFENRLDCSDAQVPAKIPLGQRETVSVMISNPHSERIERVRCLLESDVGTVIEQPLVQIRSIPPRGRIWVGWTVTPQRLGRQGLRLTVDWPEARRGKTPPLFFDRLGEFVCQAPAGLHVRALDESGEPRTEFHVRQIFVVEGQVKWESEARPIPLNTTLDYSRRGLRLVRHERLDDRDRWHLEAATPGEHRLHFRIAESDQSVPLVIKVKESPQQQIERIQADVVAPLDSECLRLTTRIRREFETAAPISFRLMRPEEYVELVYSGEVARRLRMALAAARRETEQNLPLLKAILANIAPLYSPLYGCCIPFDTELGRRWVDLHPLYEENIAQNLLYIAGYNGEVDLSMLTQNIAAYLLHEKYGHGFFYTQTRLGRQLDILYRHGFLRKVDAARLARPYPYQQYLAYKRAIEALSDSTIILNEGFAAWVELTVLPQMRPEIASAAYRRRNFLLDKDSRLDTIAKHSEYFQRFPNFRPSRYQEGYDYLNFIVDRYFGEPWGPKCAVQVVLIAADVHLGIAEMGDVVQFGLTPEEMEDALLTAERDDARADMRLRHIHSVLQQYQEWVRAEQQRLHCYRDCLHPDCPINNIIAEKLGWEVNYG